MMVKKIIFFSLIFLFVGVRVSFAFDWKALHEQADAMGFDEAKVNVEKAPDSPEALYLWGLVCLNDYKEFEAQGAFNKMLALDPQSLPASWGLAEIARRRHSLDEAQKSLRKIISEDGQFSPAYNSLAYIRYLKLDFRDSVRLAQRVLAQGAGRVDESNYALAHLLVAAGKGLLAHNGGPLAKVVYGSAIFPELRKASSIKPESAAVYLGLGSFYLLAPRLIGGDLTKAQDYLERSVAADPHLAAAYVRLGQIHRLKGDNEKYRQYLFKALEVDPGNEIALDIQSGSCKFICLDAQQ